MPDHVKDLRDLAELVDVRRYSAMDDDTADQLRSAADRLELLERQRHPFFRLGEAIQRGRFPILETGAVFEPELRRYVLSWHEWDGAPPMPGSFVVVSHGFEGANGIAAAYRVHAFERLAVGGRLATLEPVEPHDVPVMAHVRELPRPVADVTDLEDDDSSLATLEGEATHVPLCSSTFTTRISGPAVPGVPSSAASVTLTATGLCERFHEHPGEHLGPVVDPDDLPHRVELVWSTGDDGEAGGVEPRVVEADSDEADRARIREGVSAWT